MYVLHMHACMHGLTLCPPASPSDPACSHADGWPSVPDTRPLVSPCARPTTHYCVAVRLQMDDIEALNYDDLESVAKLNSSARYKDIMQAGP